jgi:hypothetical protein
LVAGEAETVGGVVGFALVADGKAETVEQVVTKDALNAYVIL